MVINEFIEKTCNGTEIPDELKKRLNGEMRSDHMDDEYKSWVNSYKALAEMLKKSKIPKDVNILLEYNLVRTPYRCDVILAGKKDGQDKLLIIELKQWEQGNVSYENCNCVRAYGKVKEHPLVQVLGYKHFFENVYTIVDDKNICVDACVYLHNYLFLNPFTDDVLCKRYEEVFVDENANNILFGKNNELEFVDFLNSAFDESSETIVEDILSSKIRLKDAFIDNILNLLEGKSVFTPTEDQIDIMDKIVKNINDNETKHNVFVVKGGPGTGKTVLAFNLLIKLAANKEHNGMGMSNVSYVTKNSQLVNSYLSVLTGDGEERGLSAFNNRTLNALFSQINSILDNSIQYDCLIVDESQRLQQSYKEDGHWKSEIIKKIVNKSKNVVLLLDEDQKLAFNDVKFVEQLQQLANVENVVVFPKEGEENEYTLYQAFRTFGSREHLDWIDHFLGYERNKNINGRLAEGYDIKVVSTPEDLFYMVHDKEVHGERARVLSGLCWYWKEENKNNNKKADIKIEDAGNIYTYSWNRDEIKNWAVNPDTVDEVGCVHTVLGQEFDYAGVIIGDDLIFDGYQVMPKPDANTQFSMYDRQRVNGMPINVQARLGALPLSQNRDKGRFDEAKEIIRNHYHILLTRGKKGCYIYCTNPELRAYLCKLLHQESTYNYNTNFELTMAEWEEDKSVEETRTTRRANIAVANGYICGRVTFVGGNLKYAYILGDDGKKYCVSEKTISFITENVSEILQKDKRVSFTVWTSGDGKLYANNIKEDR